MIINIFRNSIYVTLHDFNHVELSYVFSYRGLPLENIH
jgi:hypothetical protein